MLSIVDRYIARLFLSYFLAGLVVFATLFLVVDFMSTFVNLSASLVNIAEYYGYYLPFVIHQMAPVACLLATLFTLSRLNRNNELVALFSCGLSLARISAPILVIVVLVSMLGFVVSDQVLPSFARKKNYVMMVKIRDKPGLFSTVKADRIWYRSNNVLFNIKTLDIQNKAAEGLTFYYFDEAWKLVQLITAEHMKMNGVRWRLQDGTLTLFTRDSSFPLTQDFKKKTIVMDEDLGDLQMGMQPSEALSQSDLRKYIERNKQAGLDTLRYEVDYHAKYSFAFAAFVMSFLGIPFSVTRQRSGGAAVNIGVCMATAFAYWMFYNSGLTLGRFGVINPLLAAWGPNITMLLISLLFLVRLKK